MKYIRNGIIASMTCCLFLGNCLSADPTETTKFDPQEQFVAYSKNKPSSTSPKNNRRAIHYKHSKELQSQKSIFTQFNVGVGFLYFDGIAGNLAPQPATNLSGNSLGSFVVEKKLSYNRTPLFEYMLGYRMCHWLNASLSFQNQPGIVVDTYVRGLGQTGDTTSAITKFSSYLELNSFMFKLGFEVPYPLVVKKAAFIPYAAVGVGPSWQSWTDMTMTYSYIQGGGLFYDRYPLRQKIVANASLMVDLGVRLRSSMPNSGFSFVSGCKYNLWGQILNLGKNKQQGAPVISLTKPLKVTTLYSFAPYMGVQWNFATHHACEDALKARAQMPFWSNPSKGEKTNLTFTQLNIGVGFLYFDKVNRNIFAYEPATANAGGMAPMKGHLKYNRTPLYEFVIGFQPLSWLKYGLSMQTQQGVTISTKPLDTFSAVDPSQQRFVSHLGLNSVMAKVYFQLPYYANLYKNLMAAPYLAAGVGPGWQSWSNNVNYNYTIDDLDSRNMYLRQKISPNTTWMIDSGLLVRGLGTNNPFTVSLGCKFNFWGQCLNVGDMTQTTNMKMALWKPFTVETVYSFAPYLAMQWQFANDFSYCINNKSVNRWKPFYTYVGNIQAKRSYFTQSNVGLGFLYFSDVSYNLIGRPGADFNNLPASSPISGKLQYNRTPLYEYIVGYQAFNWLKFALSYQYQGSVFIQTPFTRGYGTGAINNADFFQQLRFQWSVNAVMAKVYFELPYALVMKGWASTPYLAVGAGPAWQSCTDAQMILLADGSAVGSSLLQSGTSIRAKYSASAAWMVDVGVRTKNANPNSNFSILAGCKYNQWGQIRNLGKMTQQGSYKNFIAKPFRAKVVYSFAPYLGVQFNF